MCHALCLAQSLDVHNAGISCDVQCGCAVCASMFESLSAEVFVFMFHVHVRVHTHIHGQVFGIPPRQGLANLLGEMQARFRITESGP